MYFIVQKEQKENRSGRCLKDRLLDVWKCGFKMSERVVTN